jgi:peptidoglycan/LPS O-acetylase OafA/YrhL
MSDGAAPRRKGLGGHVATLDGVRGLAIIMVLFVHLVGDLQPRSSFEHLVTKVSNYGVWGVDLFFVLSGFLITGILWDTKTGESYFKNFYIRRTLRIFPLYYGVLLLLFVVLPFFHDVYPPSLGEAARHQGWVWSYGTNIYLALKDDWALPYVSHFWSLAVEEHFYLFWPLVVFTCSRRALLRVCVGAMAFSLGLRWIMAFRGSGYVALQVLTPYRLDALCTGAFLAIAARPEERGGEDHLVRLARCARPALYATGGLALGLSMWHATTQILDPLTLELRRTVIGFFFGALLIQALTLGPGALWVRFLASKTMRLFGKYSYGLYVFHGIIAYALMEKQADAAWLTARLGSHLVAMMVQALAGAAFSLLVAVMSYELFEKHLLRLKDRFAASHAVSR